MLMMTMVILQVPIKRQQQKDCWKGENITAKIYNAQYLKGLVV